MPTPYTVDHATPRSKWLAYGGVIGGLGAVALVAYGFAGMGAQKNAKQGRPPAAVAVVRVESSDMPVVVKAIGTVTPTDSATVHTQLSGNVTAVLFKEGDLVRAGQPLVQIDPRPYRLALAQAQGSLARDSAQLAAARADLSRYETLAGQDSIARQQVDTQRATVGQLAGTVAYDRAAVGTAQLNLQYTTVKAPFAGRVGLKQVSVGSYATPSDTAGVAVVTRTDPIDIAFSVPQSTLGSIRAQKGSGAGLAVTALDQNGSTELAKGSFSTFDNQIDTSTGTVKAKARFANPKAALFPNQFVNVQMLVDTLSKVPVVPVSALRHGAPGDFVFVVQPDQTVKLVVVQVGPSDGVKTAVLSGIKPGMQVVSEGADGLDNGSKVRVGGQKAGKGGKTDPAAGGATKTHKHAQQ